MTNGSMTKAELVEEVSRVSDLTKKHSEVIVDTVFRSIIEALHRGEKIEKLRAGSGSFPPARKRRTAQGPYNPKTGDKVDVPPKKSAVKTQARQRAQGSDQQGSVSLVCAPAASRISRRTPWQS